MGLPAKNRSPVAEESRAQKPSGSDSITVSTVCPGALVKLDGFCWHLSRRGGNPVIRSVLYDEQEL